MRARLTFFATLLGSMALTGASHAGGATFQMIPDALSANDMTPDGRFVVGVTLAGTPYRYDTQLGVMLLLPEPGVDAVAISDDGTVILGDAIFESNPGEEIAAIWTEQSGAWTSLGALPTGGACPSRSNGYELSADGSVAVGLAWIDGCHGTGFRWTVETGMTPLEVLANGSNRASVVNATGTIIGGFAQGSFSRTPARWTGDGAGELLDPPDGDALGEVHGMNDAGTVLLGNLDGKAVKWTNGGAAEQIGGGSIIPGWSGVPLDLAANGTVVGFDVLFLSRRAWIQVGGIGPLVDLRDYALAHGAAVPSNLLLEVAQSISADGTRIIGHTAWMGGWILTVPAPAACAADLAPAGGNGVIDGADLAVVLGAWGGTGGDIDMDGTTNGADLAIVLGAWGPCEAVPGACCFGDDCAQLTAGECAALGGTFLGSNMPCTATGCVFNDHCADAVDITPMINGPTILGDNSLATPPFGGGDTELPEGSPSCQWYGEWYAAHSTVWYKFTAPENGLVTISMCDPGELEMGDSLIAIYGGSCGELVEMHCDDDGCAGTLRSLLSWTYGYEPGETYYLCIMNPGGWTGSVPGPFSFTITSP